MLDYKKRPVILYRDNELWHDEAAAAARNFTTTNSRMTIRDGDLVIGRYSVLPYYREQYRDIRLAGADLINTYTQHRYIADIANWYQDLRDITPQTWTRWEDVGTDGPYVLKGETNSRKDLWYSHMFARDKEAGIHVMLRLFEDSLVGSQKIYIREFVEFEKLGESLNGMPITKEFRFFIAYGQVVAGGFYWSSSDVTADVSEVPLSFLDEVIQRVGDSANFYVVDVAKTVDGDWMVVELNDGQMSGLSEIDPDELYKNLSQIIAC